MKAKQYLVDGGLVKEYQSGNTKTLPVLVKRWHKIFCNKAYWIVKDADVAKDIAQDSWNTIINKIENLKEPNSFGHWALRIVYTKSLDWVKLKNKERVQLQDYQKEAIEEEVDFEEKEQLRVLLLKSIKALPQHQQVVVKLFYVEGYSLKELSKSLNISEGTAKSRLFHAREKLKLTLKHRRNEMSSNG